MREPKGYLLIVDDDDEIRSVLEEILAPEAEVIHTAINGRQALEMMLKENYHCVVSDINMPEMTGLQFLAEVRKLSVSVPFIMVSGFGDQENLREALRLGAMDFIDKPFEPDHIRDVVGKALDYGALLYEIEHQLEDFFKKANFPPEEVNRLKEMQRQLLKMKAEKKVYFKG